MSYGFYHWFSFSSFSSKVTRDKQMLFYNALYRDISIHTECIIIKPTKICNKKKYTPFPPIHELNSPRHFVQLLVIAELFQKEDKMLC